MIFPFPDRDVEYEIERRAQEAERFGAVLDDLVSIGLDLARVIGFEVTNQAQANAADRYGSGSKTPGADAAAAFERVSRSVRMSIMLARSLGLPDVAVTPPESRAAMRARIVRSVEDTIGHSAPACERETLRGELMERMERPELQDDVSGRPVAEVIEEICRDLGIASPVGAEPWVRRTPDDVVALRAWAAKPPAVFVAADAEGGAPTTRFRDCTAHARDG